MPPSWRPLRWALFGVLLAAAARATVPTERKPAFILGSYAYPVQQTEWAQKDAILNRVQNLERLLALGYEREEALSALKVQSWDFDNAVNYLSSFTNRDRKVVMCLKKDECWDGDENSANARPEPPVQPPPRPSPTEDAAQGAKDRRAEAELQNRQIEARAQAPPQQQQQQSQAQREAVAGAVSSSRAANGVTVQQGRRTLFLELGAESEQRFVDKVVSWVKDKATKAAAWVSDKVDKVKQFFGSKPDPQPKKPEPQVEKAKPVLVRVLDSSFPMKLRPVVYPDGSDAEKRRAVAQLHEPGIRYQPGDPNQPQVPASQSGTLQAEREGNAAHALGQRDANGHLPAHGPRPNPLEGHPMEAQESSVAIGMRPQPRELKTDEPFVVEMRRRIASDLAERGWFSGPPGWLKSRIQAHARAKQLSAHSNSVASELWPVIVPVRVLADASGKERDVWTKPVEPEEFPLRQLKRTGPLPTVKVQMAMDPAPGQEVQQEQHQEQLEEQHAAEQAAGTGDQQQQEQQQVAAAGETQQEPQLPA